MSDTQMKHAYMIMAHANFAQLQTLLDLLDDERNDIYLHIDKKAKNVPAFSVKYSNLHMIDPISVIWGGHSQIHCEMKLLEAASKGSYRYYHLLSGMDLPLKSQDEIHAFFREHDGKEFLGFNESSCMAKDFHYRIQYYFFFSNLRINVRRSLCYGMRQIDLLLVKLQKLLHISREPIFPLYKGDQWFSITDDLVGYVLAHKNEIKKQFDYTLCPDEIFLQSVAVSSPLRDNIVNNCLRAIDWERGEPYTFRKEDVPALLASESLWGRKFDQRVDAEAIEMIAQHLGESAGHEE